VNKQTAFFGVVTVVLGAVMTLFLPKRIDESGLAFIRKHEAFASKPYYDQGGKPTIGYGSTYYPDGESVRITDPPITQYEANFILNHTIKEYEFAIHKGVKQSLTQSQYNALTSFCYNVGTSAFERSGLLRVINKDPNSPEVITQFYRWVYVKGKLSRGLLYRREKEIELYFKDPYMFPEREARVSYFRPDTIPI
jgi:lysozyme